MRKKNLSSQDPRSRRSTRPQKKLGLHRETLRSLISGELDQVAGGQCSAKTYSCSQSGRMQCTQPETSNPN